jgi:multiple sugar transport system ATP-binding protein
MNMVEATLAKSNGGYAVEAGGQRIVLDQELISARSGLQAYEGKPIVLGIRPEDLEDAALASDVPADRRIKGKMELTEALGSEIMAHFTVEAPPALTEDVRELAQDLGDDRAVDEPGTKQHTTMVGRFDARSKVKEGETVEVAVDTRGLHFFDPDSGLGIYDKEKGEEPS